MDVKLAYLHGVLEEEIYMEQLEGFITQGEESVHAHPFTLWIETKQAEFGIGSLHTQSRKNWVLTQFTLMWVYMYYAITIKGGILKQIWSSFYMSMTYYSWVKTYPR